MANDETNYLLLLASTDWLAGLLPFIRIPKSFTCETIRITGYLRPLL